MVIAKEIARQIGSSAFFMMGTKNIVASDDGLIILLKRGRHGVTHVKIVLNGSDLYDIEFLKCSTKTDEVKSVAKYEDCYFDKLKPILSEQLGMALSI